METIHHFSHSQHPLILKSLGEEVGKFKCYGCGELIKEKDNYYACEKEDSLPRFYLHKKCADLPREIILPLHQHPLTLFPSSPYGSSILSVCNICRGKSNCFTYHCSICGFDIDVKCSSLLLEGNNILQHQGHSHPLTLNPRPSSFHCDACDTKDEDWSYFCSTCTFWIHKSCASAPQSIEVPHHEDPLLLIYSLPPKYLGFKQYCNKCGQRVYLSNWVYYCDDCRYFNHLKCATASTSNKRSLTIGENETRTKERLTADYSQLVQLPFSNHDSQDATSLFVNNKNTSGAYDSGATEICHRSHDHPLSLHNDALITTNNMEACNDILCDGCVRPISVPFYSCSKCNFFLHRFCAELPEGLQCPLVPGHSMKVEKFPLCYEYYDCSLCLQMCNGYICFCASCNLQADIGCAFNLNNRIKHNSHEHALVRSYSSNVQIKCSACSDYKSSYHSFGCEAKGCRFNLCVKCIHYKGSAQHEYDRHSIPLTYPPIKDHPSDFICEICEEDINPQNWMYHCRDCNQSFHIPCLSPADWYSNVKFGGTFDIEDIHQHPLTFVRNSHSKYASPCGRCASDISGFPILECAPCGFKLCIMCSPSF